MNDPAAIAELAFRVLVAIVLGGAIGLERQWRLRTAGIRTNALVSAGSALFVIVGADSLTGGNADPTRVAAQVVSGIGFLGAGVIMRDGLKIRGLTTAATLWCAAAIGSLAGAGMVGMSLAGCLSIIGTNTLLRPLSRYLGRKRSVRLSEADGRAPRPPRRSALPARAGEVDLVLLRGRQVSRTSAVAAALGLAASIRGIPHVIIDLEYAHALSRTSSAGSWNGLDAGWLAALAASHRAQGRELIVLAESSHRGGISEVYLEAARVGSLRSRLTEFEIEGGGRWRRLRFGSRSGDVAAGSARSSSTASVTQHVSASREPIVIHATGREPASIAAEILERLSNLPQPRATG